MPEDVLVAAPQQRSSALSEAEWSTLLRRIGEGKCTPVIGSSLYAGILPPASEIARNWAGAIAWGDAFDYPLLDSNDLGRVAQCVDALYDRAGLWERLEELLVRVPPRDLEFHARNKPFGILADLPFSVYITTTYDHLLVEALRRRERDAKRWWWRWRDSNSEAERDVDSLGKVDPITVANPVVFHLYGHVGDEEARDSLVITEDDYLEFLQESSSKSDLLPARIHRAFKSNLLFLGYQPLSIEFRVLLRSLSTFLKKPAYKPVSVQVIAEQEFILPEHMRQAEAYLKQRYQRGPIIDMRWMDTAAFLTELGQRWSALPAAEKDEWRAYRNDK